MCECMLCGDALLVSSDIVFICFSWADWAISESIILKPDDTQAYAFWVDAVYFKVNTQSVIPSLSLTLCNRLDHNNQRYLFLAGAVADVISYIFFFTSLHSFGSNCFTACWHVRWARTNTIKTFNYRILFAHVQSTSKWRTSNVTSNRDFGEKFKWADLIMFGK